MGGNKLPDNSGVITGLSSVFRRIKNNCCSEWKTSSLEFYDWYRKQYAKQQGLCIYCHLPGDTRLNYDEKWFREGRRGKRLEVDRMKSEQPYSPDNCVLACYPCNNAKSDVFSYEEFIEIGKVIYRLKTRPK